MVSISNANASRIFPKTIKYPERIVRFWFINFYPLEDCESIYRNLVMTDYSSQ